MTAPDETQSTRPISVAELLAKNGTIGSPPVGGRRRRRRGNSDSVTVAELTGEIPIVRSGQIPVVTETTTETEPDVVDVVDEHVEPIELPATNGAATAAPVAPVEPTVQPPVEPEPVPSRRVEGPPPRSSFPTPRRERGPERSHDPRPLRRPEPTAAALQAASAGSGAEQMTFDPVDDAAPVLELPAEEQAAEVVELQSYLRSSDGTLFSGQTVADDLARRGIVREEDDQPAAAVAVETEPAERTDHPGGGKGAALMRGAVAVLQSILAVAFGAGLFIAFDQLWRWNNIVALVLSVLVILGLVVAVRVVRKTEDIASTLIAVAVGALVTLGPLALLQST